MLTTKGLKYYDGNRMRGAPIIIEYKENGTSFNSFVISEIIETYGPCCPIPKLRIKCTLCKFCICVDIPKRYSRLLTDEMVSEHIAPKIAKLHIHVMDIISVNNIYITAEGKFVDEDGKHTENPGIVRAKDVICLFCNRNILHGLFFKEFINFNTENIEGTINYHYYNACYNRNYHEVDHKYMREIILEHAKNILDRFELPEKTIDKNIKPYTILFDETNLCSCESNNIVVCNVCKSERKGPLNKKKLYKQIMNFHFGKEKLNYNHTDFVMRKYPELYLACIICMEQYESVANEEIIYHHFKNCYKKHSEYFKLNGYSCAAAPN